MKKLAGIITIFSIFLLAGCLPTTTEETITLSEEDVTLLIQEYIDENRDDIVDQLTQEEIDAIVQQYFIDNPVENFVSTTYDLDSFEEAITSMLDQASNGVLGVQATSSYTGGTGSGVIYKKEGNTYYLITNDHVVVHEEEIDGEDSVFHVSDEITIVYEKNGTLFFIEDTTLLGSDATTDLAVISFESDEDFYVVPFADSYDVTVGETVFAIGSPLGFDYYNTVTSGIISGEARYQVDGDLDTTLLQHDVPISPGNSGGALLNVNGELVGINNMKIVSSTVTNIGFAIPSNTVARIAADLEDDGIVTRPYLGISTYALINECGVDYGVCVRVSEGGAADAAGLEDYDVIIGYMNAGQTEYLEINNFNDLREAILNSSVGETITIKYLRNEGTVEEPIWVESTGSASLNVHPDDQ